MLEFGGLQEWPQNTVTNSIEIEANEIGGCEDMRDTFKLYKSSTERRHKDQGIKIGRTGPEGIFGNFLNNVYESQLSPGLLGKPLVCSVT